MIDPTELVVEILSEELDTPVSTEIPLQRPERLIMVNYDGDESDEFILRPRYVLMCWGSSDVDAHGIAISALHALTEAAETDPYLFNVRLESIARDEWGKTGQARYALTVELTINTDE